MIAIQQHLKIIFSIMIVGISFNLKSQSLYQKNDFNSVTTETFIVENFTGRLVDKVIYFKFLIIENEAKTTYLLESSKDGINFSAINKKQGYLSPNNSPLLYCYKATVNNNEVNYYRITRVIEQEEFHSSVLKFENIDDMKLSAANN